MERQGRSKRSECDFAEKKLKVAQGGRERETRKQAGRQRDAVVAVQRERYGAAGWRVKR